MVRGSGSAWLAWCGLVDQQIKRTCPILSLGDGVKALYHREALYLSDSNCISGIPNVKQESSSSLA